MSMILRGLSRRPLLRSCWKPSSLRPPAAPRGRAPAPAPPPGLSRTVGSSLSNSAAKGSSSSSRVSELGRLLRFWRPERWRLAAAVGLLCVSSGVTMSVPFALGRIIDLIYKIDQTKSEEEQKKKIEENLKKFCLALTGVFLLGGLCNFGRVYLIRVSAQNITARIRQLFYSSVMRREVAFFDRNKTGELVNRLSADSQLVSQTVTQQVSDGLRSSVMTMAGVGMMFFMSPQLAMVGLGVVPPAAALAVVTGRKVRRASREVQDSMARATDLAEERISNVRTVCAFARQPAEVEDFAARMREVLRVSATEARIHARFYGMTGLSGNMIILSVLYYGGSLVTSDVITVGNLASFVLYAAYVGIGLSGVSTFYAEVMKGLGASSRIFEIIDGAPAAEDRVTRVMASSHLLLQGERPAPSLAPEESLDLAKDIELKDVSFSYPTRPDFTVLQDLSLTVPANSVLAVVGSSGSGKSTLASLILRFYDPSQGSICIGGTDIRDMDVFLLRQRVGTVSQEPVLFSSSIRDNILYGSVDPSSMSHAVVEEAAREANAHEFVTAFPDGYDTLVGERGVLLSGGQKQRIAIARAIVRNPQILLLDEATSALDAASEHQVKEALYRVMQGRTVITIAHRLSTILNADKIVVLKDGKIVEEGTYDQLASMEDGHFKQLITKQTVRSR